MYDKNYLNENLIVNTEILDEIDSTNEEAKRRILSGACEDFSLIARKQTAGKGRKGRNFYSPKDTGIYFTFVHFTDQAPEDLLKVTVAASVICAKAIKEAIGVSCKIKWVNDLYYNDKKVSGTLCELILKDTYGNSRNAVIVGTGINLSTEDFPEEISGKAGSLETDGNNKSIDDIVIRYSNGLHDFFLRNDLKEYMPLYRQLSLVLGREVELSDASGFLDKGWAEDFDDEGAIIIRTDSGELKRYDSGEISLLLS
ncbi:MAG: biotin--[acetyl-CoA-carboxylase] ligase [Lachnospiraceae bacterium]|nr:biotin--[acetyl-CoA-carboxylase] ligase [Lachnospiraceae bacterium]